MKTNYDKYQRYRDKTVSFRVSDKESAMINRMVKLSGMTKQGYIRTRLECKDVVVIGNPKVYKGLKYLLVEVCDKLESLAERDAEPDPELLETIRVVANVLDRMKKNER